MKRSIIIPIIFLLGMLGLFFTFPTFPVTATSITHYYEDFESELSSEWTTGGQWHIEDNDTSNYPITDPSVEIPSGSHYMWFGDNTTGTYVGSGYLTIGPIDLGSITGKVEFSYYTWLAHYNEYLDVQYSPNGGDWYNFFTGWLPAQTLPFIQWSHEIPDYAKTSTFYARFRFNENYLSAW